MALQVEFCTGCGYYQKFAELSSELRQTFPNLKIVDNPIPPRMKTFEVSLGQKLLFSKLSSDRFPAPGEIVALIAAERRHRRLVRYSTAAVAIALFAGAAALVLRSGRH